MSDDFDFKVMTDNIWQATQNEWMSCWAEQNEHESPYFISLLNKCNPKTSNLNQVQANGNTSICYVVTPKDADVALAVVEFVESKSLKQLRVLAVNISPGLEQSATPSNRDQIDYISWITSTALLGALELTMKGIHSTSLKIRLSYPMTAVFLRNALKNVGLLSLEMAGNWLTVHIKSH